MEKTNKERGYINSLDEVLELHGENLEKIREREKLDMIVTIANNLMQSKKNQHTRGFVTLITYQLINKLTNSEKEKLLANLATQVKNGIYEHL